MARQDGEEGRGRDHWGGGSQLAGMRHELHDGHRGQSGPNPCIPCDYRRRFSQSRTSHRNPSRPPDEPEEFPNTF
ncbi:hypothetical protein [Streptomyces sp. NPDC051994]|uniref:hypothetical protein n=1 Tax=unclassified Streptomyces TaxID=2593676 RepID=UPI003436491A